MVREGKVSITKEQSKLLYNHIKNNNRLELKAIYGFVWNIFKANEQIMIEDLYWNGGNKLVEKKTNFYKNMVLYAESSQLNYLEASLLEIQKYSNPEHNHGIQNRRNVQVEMA